MAAGKVSVRHHGQQAGDVVQQDQGGVVLPREPQGLVARDDAAEQFCPQPNTGYVNGWSHARARP